MNLKEIRNAMFAQADWSPDQSPDAKSRVNGFINRAYNQLALEAPFLFFETEAKIATEPDVESKVGDPDNNQYDRIRLKGNNDLIYDETDPWTWTVCATSVSAAAKPSLFNEWKYDRSWDGRLIEIIKSDGTVIRNQIRTIWLDDTSGRYEFTLVRPWDIDAHGAGTDSTGFEYRIYTEDYALPDDVIQVKSMQLFDQTSHYPLQVMGQREAEQRSLNQPRKNLASGIPSTVFRRKHEHLPGPSVAPEWRDVDVLGWSEGNTPTLVTPWKGPEPPGVFQYMITYTWGKRDVEFRLPGLAHWRGQAKNWTNTGQTFEKVPRTSTSGDAQRFDPARNRYREPRYESAPSPVSGYAISHRVGAIIGEPKDYEDGQRGRADGWTDLETSGEFLGYSAIRLRLPNIEHALGFGGAFTTSGGASYSRLSKHQSGFHIRIYRRRVTVDMSNYSDLPLTADGLNKMDNADAFYLLAETRVDEVNGGEFVDNGELIPDYSRRLRDTHGYQTFGVYPKPNKRYEIDVRCVQRPPELSDDDDTPLLHSEATNVLINRAMVLMYESMGSPAMAQYAQERYEQQLETLSKRYGDLRPPGVPVLRRLSRSRFGTRRTDFYRKWYSTDST
jgi:hypothetical protein